MSKMEEQIRRLTPLMNRKAKITSKRLTANLLCHSLQSNLLALTEIIMISEVCSTRAQIKLSPVQLPLPHTEEEIFRLRIVMAAVQVTWLNAAPSTSCLVPVTPVQFSSPQFSSVHHCLQILHLQVGWRYDFFMF